jgi:hypothetical protein
MFPDGILRPALFQLPVIKYGAPISVTPSPVLPKYGPPDITPLPTFTPSLSPSLLPTPTPDLRDMLVLPVMVVVSIGIIIFLIACAVVGFVWLSGRGKNKK